jgi:transposase-like protein
VITDLRSGELHPTSLSTEDRRRCVLLLQCEGMSVAEIARLLGVCERTIARDRVAIHQEHAIEPDPQLRGRIAGQLMLDVDAARTELRRASRHAEARPADRIEAAKSLVEVQCKAIERLQSLGILPNSASHHHTHVFGEAELPDVEDLRGQAKELYATAKAAGDDATCKDLLRVYKDLKHIGATEAVGRAAQNAAERSEP